MKNKKFTASIASGLAIAAFTTSPVSAAKKAPVELTKCETSFGTIAVVDGDTQGWSKFGLGSPRELVVQIARESGCFSIYNAGNGGSTDFLINVIAGDKEEVDKGVQAAKGLASTALLRSGAAGQVLGKVPGAGALMGMFGGFGGKKKTVAAGIRVVSPANGQTLASGTGQVKKPSLSFRGASTPWIAGANAAGYGDSKKGKMLTEAFIIAFNSVVAQAGALTAAQPKAVAPVAKAKTYAAAVSTNMYATADGSGTAVRSLRADTQLNPTGEKSGLFVEVTDNYGTKGWVSVEDLR